MKKILLFLITCSSISFGMTMEQENRPNQNHLVPLSCCLRSSTITPIESETDNIVLRLPKNHCWERQKYETLNAQDTESYTQNKFAALIKAQHDKQAIYNLARITTMVAQKPVIHYLDAAESQKAENKLNPLNRAPITRIDFFEIKSNNPRRAIHTFTIKGSLSQEQSANPLPAHPTILCPSCRGECIGTMCCCVIFPAIMVPGAILGDAILCPFTPCAVGYINYCYGASDSAVDFDNYCVFTKDALKDSREICQLCCALQLCCKLK